MQFLVHVKGADQGPSEARASLEAPQQFRVIGGEPGWRQLLLDNAAGADQLACRILTAGAETPPSVILAHRTNEDDLAASLRLIRLADSAQGGEILASEEFYRALDRSTQDSYGSVESRGKQRLRPRFRDEPPAFVISPIGRLDSEVRTRADLVFDTLIKPACRARGFRPERADHVFTDQIRSEMMRRLARDTLVLAYLDRSPWSANVMLEVGFRLQSGRPVVFLMDGEAKEPPPFDLGDHQVLQIPSVMQLAEGVDGKLVEDLAGAIRAALKERTGADDWPHPVASIRMRLGKEGGKHPVQEAYGSANDLFNRSSVAGTHVAELIEGIRPFMPKAQFESFSDEQSTLIGRLVQAAGSPGTVRATVPMFFATHPNPTINHRAFLPVIVSYRIDQRDSELGLLVLYLEVTAAATVGEKGIVRCEVSNEGDRSALFWDLYAWSYDEILPRLSFYKTAIERHFKALSGCAQVLEIGAGTGNLCQRLVAAGANVTAVDRSRAMADRMREKRRAMRVFVDRWCILQQGAESLAIVPDQYADGVSILLSLFAMQTPGKALKEALRVLKPGGTLVVTEPKASFDIRSLLDLAQKELEEEELSPNDEHWARVKDVNLVIAPSKTKTWITAERIRERLETARFTIESVEDSHHGHCATLIARAP